LWFELPRLAQESYAASAFFAASYFCKTAPADGLQPSSSLIALARTLTAMGRTRAQPTCLLD